MLLLLLACHAPDAAPADERVDLRIEPPDPPEGGLQFRTPDLEVAPYSEVMYCYYGTYSGPEVGVNYMALYSANGVTHHNQLKAVYDDEHPDGTLAECPGIENGMAAYYPLFEATGYPTPGGVPPVTGEIENWINLPEGMAQHLETGQRWVIDVHYVNTTADTLLVNSTINLGTVPADEVTTWAGTIQFDAGNLALPPQQETTITFSCSFDADYSILSFHGHMHDRGTAYSIDWTSAAGTERIYTVDPWGPEYREWPKVQVYAPGEFMVSAGDSFTTTCSWYNETDETLGFPDEMCTTLSVVAPLGDPIHCEGPPLE